LTGPPCKALDASLQTQDPDVTMDDVAAGDIPKGADAPLASPTSLVLQNLDVVLVALALVPALLLGAPAIGFVLGACGWVLQRMVAVIDRRWTSKATDPVRELVMNLFEAFGRIWLLAGVIVLAAVLGERPDGLTAAVVIIGAYSVAFVIRLLSGPPGRRAGE